MKLKASELRTIAIYSKIIPLYKKMGFKTDSQISILSENALYDIENAIGKKLSELKEDLDKLISKIREPFIEEFEKESEGLEDEAKIELGKIKFDPKIQAAVDSDDKYRKLLLSEIELWNSEIETDISPVIIEDKEYAELLVGENKTANVLGRDFTLDGYECLIKLLSQKFGGEYFVKIKETE